MFELFESWLPEFVLSISENYVGAGGSQHSSSLSSSRAV